MEPLWNEINGSFRDFLNEDWNVAEEYLVDGVNWYQMQLKINGTDYYIPMAVNSEKIYYESKYPQPPRYQWTFTLPQYEIKHRKWKTKRDLNRMHGEPRQVHAAPMRSCMSIIKYGDSWYANIDWIRSSKYLSGKEIMAIFMTIAVKKNLDLYRISLDDTSKKPCAKLRHSKYWDGVWQSLFMGFLGRLDFYREWGFFVVKDRIQRNETFGTDKQKQAEYDAASMKLPLMKVSEVIRGAIRDNVRGQGLVRPLIDALMRIEDKKGTALMKDYLKPLSDNWEKRCDEYVLAIEGLKQVPTIRRKYIDKLKKTDLQVPLIWEPSELDTFNCRLASVQG